jgi:hypothetical protein
MADIRYSLQIAAEPEAIYPLVSTATGFGEWWAEDVTESPFNRHDLPAEAGSQSTPGARGVNL